MHVVFHALSFNVVQCRGSFCYGVSAFEPKFLRRLLWELFRVARLFDWLASDGIFSKFIGLVYDCFLLFLLFLLCSHQLPIFTINYTLYRLIELG